MEQPGFRCDFCGRLAPRVRRVALDRDYDRLSQRHAVRYACETCSRIKEKERRARDEEKERRERDVDARRGGA